MDYLLLQQSLVFQWFYRLNGKNAAFGQVIDGMDLVKLMETQGSQNGEPRVEVTIVNCGVL